MENMSHVHHEAPSEHHAPKPKMDNKKNLMLGLGAVAIILIVLAVANFSGGLNLFGKGGGKLSPDEARERATKFINEQLVSGTTANITEVTDYSDTLYKLAVKVGDNNIESYITKDGTMFFPQAMPTDATTASATTPAATTPVAPANVKKSDKPKVELYIMSHCPFGTQAEKGAVPVAQLLGDKIDFKIRFVPYAMHGLIEVQDNMLQYCIDKEDHGKYADFLGCFLKSGNSASCVSSTGVNKGKVDKCIESVDKQYKITEAFNDKTKWDNGSFPPFPIDKADADKAGVQGSPTLVINGDQVESDRSQQGFLTTICAAFNNAPEECKTKLDTATPSSGFGDGTAASTGSNAACAPS